MTNEELAVMYQGGKKEVIGELYTRNASMIEKIIRRYKGVEELDDLRQESYFGLVKAADLWKPERETAFMTYAVYWIRAAITRYIEECSTVVRIPSHRRVLMGKYHRAMNGYRVRFGCDPSDRELCAALDISKDQLEKLRADIKASQIRSTAEVVGGEDDDVLLEDTLAAEGDPIGDLIERVQHEELSAELWSCVDDLEPRESAVIRSRYGNEQALTLKECGENLGVSVERVRQVEAAALRKLRKPRYTKRLLPYLDEGTAHRWSLSGTGFGTFNRYGSVQERAMMRLEGISKMNLYHGFKFPEYDGTALVGEE